MMKKLIALILTGLLGLAAGNAGAIFHIFQMTEFYSNADGTIQYVEFLGLADGQHVWATHSMTSTNGVVTNTYNFTTNLPSSSTSGKSVLVATQGFANLGIVTPDYIIPDGFLFTGGGTVSFPGMDTVDHTALPTNGILSINRTGVQATNSPKNFAGATGTVPAFALTVSKAGTGAGTITSSPAGINCGATCSANFGKNNPITLTATPDGGSVFSNWSDACSGSGGCTVTMDAAKSVTASFAVAGDTQPPTAPTGLTATAVSISQIDLTWTASDDNIGVAAYRVLRGGVFRTTVNFPTVNFSDNAGLTASTSYSYTVAACDAAGNCSAPSAAASATTQAGPDMQPPSVPAGLTATAMSDSQINLSWTAATDNVSVTQYRIYRDTALIVTLTGAPPATSYSNNTGLTASTAYGYTVAACDAFANCSAQSTPPVSATTLAAGQFAYYPQLEPGFNLIGNALNVTIDVAATFGNQTVPVDGVTEYIFTIWKWNAAGGGRWAFYSPQKTVDENAAFVVGKYDLLSFINPGEGYWVNAVSQVALPAQTGTNFIWISSTFHAMNSGFHLIAHASPVFPTEFNSSVSLTPPGIGAIPTDNFVTLWAWNAVLERWYFYAPQKQVDGGLAAVQSYANSRNFLHFQDYNKTLGHGVGFWVNRP